VVVPELHRGGTQLHLRNRKMMLALRCPRCGHERPDDWTIGPVKQAAYRRLEGTVRRDRTAEVSDVNTINSCELVDLLGMPDGTHTSWDRENAIVRIDWDDGLNRVKAVIDAHKPDRRGTGRVEEGCLQTM
jgi:hypothetical protein